MQIRAFVQRHPAAAYFTLTFAISWGGIVALIASGQSGLLATKEEFERLLPVWVPVLVLGPSLSGLLLTAVVDGRHGLRAFRARLTRWRVDARWYAAALLIAPLYFAAAALALSAFDPDMMPAVVTADDRGALVARGVAIALTAGIFEELGWTGFAVPALRRRHGTVATGLIVGALWGAWHFLPKIWGSAAHDLVAYMPVDLGMAVVGLTGFRILMVWVYDRSGSLLVAILMHASLTASTLILQPPVTGAPLVVYGLVTTAAVWAIVGAVVLVEHRRHRHGSGAGPRPGRPAIPTPHAAH